MTLLTVNNLRKIGREQDLFSGVTFGLQEGEKAALIGRNGSGKSTLLNTIAGVLQPDDGSVVFNRECGVSFLPQNPVYEKNDTIRDHIFKSKSEKLKIIREYEQVCEEMADRPNLAKRYEELNKLMEDKNLWNYESQISSILSKLGIHDLDRKMGELSGGMIKKVSLAQVLVEDSKLLLLDEPTNHLDITTITWLQKYLHDTEKSVLMVTHDRYFLDAVCNNIYELARRKLTLYHGNYSEYLEKKEMEAEIEANTERRIESVLRFEREWLLRGPCARGTKIKARIQRDEQLINREKFQADKGFTFEVKGRRLGGKVLELHGISKSFEKGFLDPDGKREAVLKDFSYVFTKGQKIGIFGDNGSGKSTLLNIITGNLEPDSGTVTVGENTFFGYYNQNPVFPDTNMTVLEYVKEVAQAVELKDGTVVRPEKFLEEFGFEGRVQYCAVSTLSGGERKRLFLVRLLLTNPNFLILDEPTNDFDIFTMNILEQFLMQYQGCLLIVSHDRYFMDKVADTLFILEDDGSVSGFVGKCSEYVEYRDNVQLTMENGQLGTGKGKKSGTEEKKSEEESNLEPVKKKLSYKEQKEFESLDAEIPTLESRKSELENVMGSGTVSGDEIVKATAEYNALCSELDEKYQRWTELAERM